MLIDTLFEVSMLIPSYVCLFFILYHKRDNEFKAEDFIRFLK